MDGLLSAEDDRRASRLFSRRISQVSSSVINKMFAISPFDARKSPQELFRLSM